jgi:hypothetical protein
MYADRDAIITADIRDDDEPPSYWQVHLKLKKGWNLVIASKSGNSETLVTGTPGAGYRWVLSDD